MPERINTVIKLPGGAIKNYFQLFVKEFHKFYLNIGLFHYIFLYIEYKKLCH